MEDERGVTETLTDRVAGRTSPGVLNPVSWTFNVAKATIWKIVPSGGRCDLPFPDPARLHSPVGTLLSGCVGGLMG